MWQCEEEGCGQSFTRRSVLARHARTKHGVELRTEEGYTCADICNTCPRTFKRMDHLIAHVKADHDADSDTLSELGEP